MAHFCKCFDLKLFTKQNGIIVGWNDVKLIAKRYKQVFPHIFGDKYDEGKFLFRYTDVHRTEASYQAFVEGRKPFYQIRNVVLPFVMFCPFVYTRNVLTNVCRI